MDPLRAAPFVALLLLAAPVRASAEAPEAPDRPAASERLGPAPRAGRVVRADAPGPPPPAANLGKGHLRLDAPQAAAFQRPELLDPACLPGALQRRPAAAGLENTVKFAVRRDGSVSHFSFATPVAPEVERAVAEAFADCPWQPGLDPDGRPLAVWVVQPLKVAPLPPPPAKQRPLFD